MCCAIVTPVEIVIEKVLKKISNQSKGCRDVCLAMKKSAINNVLKQGGNTEW